MHVRSLLSSVVWFRIFNGVTRFSVEKEPKKLKYTADNNLFTYFKDLSVVDSNIL